VISAGGNGIVQLVRRHQFILLPGEWQQIAHAKRAIVEADGRRIVDRRTGSNEELLNENSNSHRIERTEPVWRPVPDGLCRSLARKTSTRMYDYPGASWGSGGNAKRARMGSQIHRGF
jgi:hypothetical protein